MKKPLRDVAASLWQRRFTLAHDSGQPDGELLDRYCIERLLYRLSRSPHREQFILKGAMLLTAWGGGVAQRSTRDAGLDPDDRRSDLFGQTSHPDLFAAARRSLSSVASGSLRRMASSRYAPS